MSLNNDLIGPSSSQSFPLARGASLEKELTIADLWGLMVRRRAIIVLILLFFILAGALVCIFSTRRILLPESATPRRPQRRMSSHRDA